MLTNLRLATAARKCVPAFDGNNDNATKLTKITVPVASPIPGDAYSEILRPELRTGFATD